MNNWILWDLHPHHLLLRHTLTLILHWHKQHLNQEFCSIKTQNLYLAAGWIEQTFFSFHTVFLTCINWFKRFHSRHHLKLKEYEADNFYFLKLYFLYVFKENKYEKHHCKHHYSNCSSRNFLDATHSDSRWNKMPCLSCFSKETLSYKAFKD